MSVSKVEEGHEEDRRQQSGIVKNFCNKTVIISINGGKEQRLDPALVGGGAMVNLIPQWVVGEANLAVVRAKSLDVRGFDGRVTLVLELLLSRRLMSASKVLGVYGRNETWIRDPVTNEQVKVEKCDTSATGMGPAPEVCFNRRIKTGDAAVGALKNSARSPKVLEQLENISNGDYTDQAEESLDELVNKLIMQPPRVSRNFNTIWLQTVQIPGGAVSFQALTLKPGIPVKEKDWKDVHFVVLMPLAFTAAETRYTTTKRDGAGPVEGPAGKSMVGGWQHIARYDITDHASLLSVLKSDDGHGRIARWQLEFGAFWLDVVHVSGNTLVAPDGLSGVSPDHAYRPLFEKDEEFQISDLVPGDEAQRIRPSVTRKSYRRIQKHADTGEVLRLKLRHESGTGPLTLNLMTRRLSRLEIRVLDGRSWKTTNDWSCDRIPKIWKDYSFRHLGRFR
ncbi:hypothetical protein AYL99_11691 [Fonsecaea erecta]|uniref:Uncharacterized protein n=1 Tax=Fonsecaea erecta TaxID=1367422 RepID=A0A178Z3U7_9EURO|nr:hypothetical protein AYL99_11691 [Fonsecaea erecta]OAP54156.1 hypothetical protein AYL99_11691 [Fonsecaea erecta]